jgi:hypothetical protein
VRSTLLVGGTSPLAGNLTLLFTAHRSKPSTFLACSVHGTLLNAKTSDSIVRSPPQSRDPRAWSSRSSRYVPAVEECDELRLSAYNDADMAIHQENK